MCRLERYSLEPVFKTSEALLFHCMLVRLVGSKELPTHETRQKADFQIAYHPSYYQHPHYKCGKQSDYMQTL